MGESVHQIWAMRKQGPPTMNGLLIPGHSFRSGGERFLMRRIGRLCEPAVLVLGAEELECTHPG